MPYILACICLFVCIKEAPGSAPELRKQTSSPLSFTSTEYVHVLPHASIVAQLSFTELSALKQYSSYLFLTTIDKHSILAPCSSIWSGFLTARDLLLTVRIKFSRCLIPCSSPLRRFRLIRCLPPFFLKFLFVIMQIMFLMAPSIESPR